MTTWSGTLPTITAGPVILGSDIDTIRDAIGGVTDAWTSYTPAWSASTPPAIGNGTITGKYIRSGKYVTATVGITMGSTTTFGAGGWTVSLPVTAASTDLHVGAALVYDASLDANRRAGAVFLNSTTVVSVAADGLLAAAVPFTWAVSDVLRFTITYEAA